MSFLCGADVLIRPTQIRKIEHLVSPLREKIGSREEILSDSKKCAMCMHNNIAMMWML